MLQPKRKEEKGKESKKNKKEKEFIPPELADIENYVLEKNLKVDAKKFYDYFTEGNWIDSKGNQVKNWKQKLLTWNGYSNNQKETKKTNFEGRKYSSKELDFLYANEGGIKQ